MESDLTQWVREDTASLLNACDKVFGTASVSVAVGAIVCWGLGKVSALSAILAVAFPLLNLALTQVGAYGRVRAEIARIALNAPLMVAIYAYSDGPLRGMWLPLLIMVAGAGLLWPVLTRNVKYGYVVSLWYIALFVIGAVLSPQDADAGSVLWPALSIFVVGFVLSTAVARLGVTVIEARIKRSEAESHKREVQRSLHELDERNRGMRLVLDSVAQGFITIDHEGVMASERSAIVDDWFGTPAPGAMFVGFVAGNDPDLQARFAMGLESVRDGYLPLELCLDQLPKRFVSGTRTFGIKYSPFTRDDQPGILLVISDITEHVIRERAEREQRELVTLFQRITSDRAGFDGFMDDAHSMVTSLAVPGDPLTERRTIHTLKGNCAIYGFEGYAELCHEIENELVETGEPLSAKQRSALGAAWGDVIAQVMRLLGETRRNVVEVEYPELVRLVDKAKRGIASHDLAAELTAWSHEPVVKRFERLARYATGLARRLNKGDVDIEIKSDGIRLDPARWASFWTAVVHAVRNAVDHGIDGPRARELAGKAARPTLQFAATRTDNELIISVADDGGGIDWDLVRARARAHGIPAESQADLEQAVFADGFSTRQEVTDTSGRGVGMAALRAAVEQLGGTIEIDSQPARGTTMRCRFPEPDLRLLQPRAPSQPLRADAATSP